MRLVYRADPVLQSLLVAALSATALLGQGGLARDPVIESIEPVLEETAAAAAAWQQPLRWALLAGLAAGAVLLAASVMRRGRCRLCRPALAACGALLGVFSLAAHRELDRQFDERKLRAQRLIEQARLALRSYDAALAPADRRQWRCELLARLREIGSLAPDRAAGTGATELAGPAAAGTPPSWAASPPAHGASLYFAGSGRSSSLEGARRASLDEALNRACTAVWMEYSAGGRRRSDPLDPARLRQYLTEATAVKTTWFDYEPGERRFRYYTLLSLSPVLAQPDLVRALSN